MINRSVRTPVLIGLAAAMSWGCTDNVPTLSEAGPLLPGETPTTIQYVLGTDAVLQSSRVRAGGLTSQQASYLLVANRFGESLTAHTLGRFRAFPDTVVFTDQTDSLFTYLPSEVVATVPDSLEATPAVLDFELWTVVQPWDSTAVTWEYAVNRPDEQIPWVTPGGTRGQRIGMARWDREEPTDSLKWELPADIVTRLARGEIPGLMVTLLQTNARAQISRLTIRASIRPSVRTDTTVVRVVNPGPHDFIHTPEAPQPADLLRVGGITGDRSYLVLDLSTQLPVCPGNPAGCQTFAPVDEVSLNRVELLLDPVPVTGGFRPLKPMEFAARRVFEPELGERAPLGPVVAIDTVSVAQAAGTDTAPVSVNLTAIVERLLFENQDVLALALLVEPAGANFSYGWFSRNPRLRFIYTLSQRPELP